MKFIIKPIGVIVMFFAFLNSIFSQVAGKYTVSLDPLSIEGFTGLQSFAKAQFEDKLVLIGGRTDGLHRRQPNFSFLASDNNTDIIVIAPESKQIWKRSINSLSANLKEQLQSTNMQFIQRGTILYLTGGYGFSATTNNHITYDKLTAVDIPNLIAAVQSGADIAPLFRQIANPIFAITGGQIGRIDSTFYLVGGHNFTGRYNPDNGPSFVQAYGNQIHRFKIQDNDTTLSIYDISTTIDAANLHRRDYNMLPQIFAGNKHGFTVFSGVFQSNADLPFLNSVDIFPTNHVVNNTFTQYLNHYHSAKIALYDSVSQKMENLFLGGISQYYDSSGVLIQDNNAPFTKAIANVVREASGKMTETRIGDMPDFLGAGAEFFIQHNIPAFDNEIIKSNQLSSDNILLGYILGGIKSSAKNIFFTNTGSQSDAHNIIYKVFLKKNTTSIEPQPLAQHSVISQLHVAPNPSNGNFQLRYWLSKPLRFSLKISNIQGLIIQKQDISHTTAGEKFENLNIQLPHGTYFISLQSDNEVIARKIIID